jgi:hypothetical protein
MIPETESVSWVMAVTSAAASWASAVTLRRRSPTILDMTRNTGMDATDTAVSCQDMEVIATRVLMNMAVLDRTLDRVLVTTFCIPPTSLAIRDWISPVRVPVKNPSDRLWRCVYSLSRRSRITRWPTMLVALV